MNDLALIRKDNCEQEKFLLMDNLDAITDMIVYLSSFGLCEYDIEIIRKDLISMALEAQLRGEKFSNVIGQDYKSFCDELIISCDKTPTKEKILNYSFGATIVVSFMFLVEMIIQLCISTEEILKGYMSITWGFALSTLLVIVLGYGMLTFMSKNSFKIFDKHSTRTFNLFGIAFIINLCIIGLIKWFLMYSVIGTINYFYPLIILSVTCIVIKSINK